MKIPFVTLSNQHEMLRQSLLEKFQQALADSSFILGSEVEKFEKAYAEFSGTRYCVGVGNGTDALQISLQTLDIESDHEVIVPVNTFMATASAVVNVGAKLILTDVEQDSFHISNQSILPHLSPKTKVIIPVHLYGVPCQMDEIMRLANEKCISVIEDNAQAQGATHNGKTTGSFGSINATSFYPTKNLGALGDAGAITTDDENLYRKARLLRNLGSETKYEHHLYGQNSRLDSLQAAFLSAKLSYVRLWNNERQRIAARYHKNLSYCTYLSLPPLDKDSVFHVYVVRVEERDKLQLFLESKQIQTLIHYPTPIHLQPAFKQLGYGLGDFPVAEKQCKQVLSLPLYIGMRDDEIDYVCEHILQFYK